MLGHPLSKLPPTGAATSDSVTQRLTFSQRQLYVDMLARTDPKSAFSVCGVGGEGGQGGGGVYCWQT